MRAQIERDVKRELRDDVDVRRVRVRRADGELYAVRVDAYSDVANVAQKLDYTWHGANDARADRLLPCDRNFRHWPPRVQEVRRTRYQ
jgi:hypothetical protein